MFPWCLLEEIQKCMPSDSLFVMTKQGSLSPFFRGSVWDPAVSRKKGEGQLALRNILWVSCALRAPNLGGAHHQPVCKQKGDRPHWPSWCLCTQLACVVYQKQHHNWCNTGGKAISPLAVTRLLLCLLVLEDYSTESIRGVARIISPSCLKE